MKIIETELTKENIELINWETLCKNFHISEEIFDKYNDKLNFKSLSENIFRTNTNKEIIINWFRKNPQYSFDNLLYKYI